MSDFATTLTLIGGPTLLIEIGGFRLLTDPTFDAPGDYQSGPVTLRKTQGPALSAAEIGRIDAVLLTHDQHADNLDPAGRRVLGEAQTVLTTRIGAERLAAEGLGVARGLAPWENVELTRPDGGKLHITATPARHGPVGIEPIAGDVIGFLIGLDRPGERSTSAATRSGTKASPRSRGATGRASSSPSRRQPGRAGRSTSPSTAMTRSRRRTPSRMR
jgi:L-ascorbate metabolism protein UlaG (beta-lactamase superfamily)